MSETTFDVKAWHRRKAAEVQAREKVRRQIEVCYKRYIPPQIRYKEEMELTEDQEAISELMQANRAAGL